MIVNNSKFSPNDIVRINDKGVFDAFNDVLGVEEWVVSHTKKTKKNELPIVVCYPLKNGVKGVLKYQFLEKALVKA